LGGALKVDVNNSRTALKTTNTMSKRLKQLNETRSAKKTEARTLLDKAKDEKRSLTSEEVESLDKIQTEVESIDSTITSELRQLSIESQNEAAELSKQEKRDVQKFSIGRALKLMQNEERLDGIEKEIADEGRKEATESGVRSSGKGIMIPFKVLKNQERRDMTATGGTGGDQGGMTVQTNITNLYDSFFNRLVLRGLGSTVFEGLMGNLDLPRIIEPSDPAHKAENATADEISPTMAKLSLSPNRLPAVVEASNQLFIQSNENIEAFLQNHLLNKLSVLVEKKLINGGGSNEPTGMLGTSGIGDVAGGTNGLAPTIDHIIDLETEVSIDNADIGALSYLTNTKVRGRLKKTPIESGQTDRVWPLRGPVDLNGYNAAVTNSVPSDLDKGTSTGVCSAILFGNWNDNIMAFWSGIEFLLNPYSKDDEGLTRINAAVYYDGGIVRPVSFSAMQDALTA
jgi:HK97 family phage major capsid protein